MVLEVHMYEPDISLAVDSIQEEGWTNAWQLGTWGMTCCHLYRRLSITFFNKQFQMPMPSFEQERLRTHWTASTQRAALLRQEEFLTFARPQRRDLSASEMPMGFSKSVCWISPPNISYISSSEDLQARLPLPSRFKKTNAAGWRNSQCEICTMPRRVGGIDSLASRGEGWNGSTLRPKLRKNGDRQNDTPGRVVKKMLVGLHRFFTHVLYPMLIVFLLTIFATWSGIASHLL